MVGYEGVIIEESLEDKAVLSSVRIMSTKVEQVTDEHETPWLAQWTLHTVEVEAADAERIAEEIRTSLDRSRGGSWYADFKNDVRHYIVFAEKIFRIDRTSKEQYDEAKLFGISLGIPEHQVDFHPDVEEWER